MGLIEIIRVVLYVIEWIWTTVILLIFPARLATTAPTVNNTMENICLFNANVGRSRCDYGLYWSAIALIILSATIAWYAVEYCTHFKLPERAEMLIFGWLAVWWLIASIAFTITKSSRAPPIATIPVVFAWMLVVLCVMSALVTGYGTTRKPSLRVPQTRIQEPESVVETVPS